MAMLVVRGPSVILDIRGVVPLASTVRIIRDPMHDNCCTSGAHPTTGGSLQVEVFRGSPPTYSYRPAR